MAVGDIVTIGALQVVDSSGNTKKLQKDRNDKRRI